MGTIAKVTAGGATHLIASTAYATCSTEAATAAKVATIQDSQDFTLINGVTVHVYFINNNTASNPTLNVNSTGAKPIRLYGNNVPSGGYWGNSWKDKSIVSFTYNTDVVSTGCWLMNDATIQTANSVVFDYQGAEIDYGVTIDADNVYNAIIDVYNQTKNVNSDWTAAAGASSILNKPAIPSTYLDVGAMSAGGVSIDRKVSTGTNIADITINGTTTQLYAPTGSGGDDKVLIVTYGDSTTSAQLSAAILAGKTIFCRVDEDPDFNLLPLTYYNTEDDIYQFGGVCTIGTEYIIYYASWDTGWDNAANYTIPSFNTTTWYGTSSTAAATSAKVVTISGFTSSNFIVGAIVGILFTTANTAATPTLNINSLGERTIYMGSSTTNSTTNVLKWSANTMIYFMYDGTRFRYMYASAAATVAQPRGANTWYGTSSTTAATQAKTSLIDNFVLTKGALVTINFSTANTYNGLITLNINSTGAKSIYYKNAVTSSTNKPLWKANSTITFVYSGTYYYIVNISPLPTDQIPDADEIPFVPRAQQWQDPLYDQTLGETIGSSLENSLNFTYHSIIQVYNDTSQTIEVTDGDMNFIPFNAIHYKNDVDGIFSLDSTGGVKVSQAGYYRVSGNILGYTNSNAVTSSSQGNYRRGLYVFAGTAPNTTDCTEWVSHVEYSCYGVAFGISSQIIYANQNDIIYLVFRTLGQDGKYNPGLLRQSFLNIESLPDPYPTS